MNIEDLTRLIEVLYGDQQPSQPTLGEHPEENENKTTTTEYTYGPISRMDYAVKNAFEERWRVFPLYGTMGHACDCPLGNACPQPGAHPRTRSWHRRATEDRNVLISWWNTPGWQYSNVGIATGRSSDLVVLEVENTIETPADETLKRFCESFHWIPQTLTVRTGNGGLQLYFRAPVWLGYMTADQIVPGVSIRGENDFVVAPGSLFPEGMGSHVVDHGPILRPTLPDFLHLVMRQASRCQRASVERSND